jgi:hypothetical protein
MDIALIVAPGQAGQLYHVAAIEASVTKPDALIWVHRERWRTIFVIRKWATPDPLLTDASQATRAAEPICQVYDRHSLFSGVNRLRVGDAPISGGASFLGLL